MLLLYPFRLRMSIVVFVKKCWYAISEIGMGIISPTIQATDGR